MHDDYIQPASAPTEQPKPNRITCQSQVTFCDLVKQLNAANIAFDATAGLNYWHIDLR